MYQEQAKRPKPIQATAISKNASQHRLTKRTLIELRRSADVVQSVPKLSRRPSRSAAVYLHKCTPAYSRELKKFSQRGGPDLTDLRRYPAPAGFRAWSVEPTFQDRKSWEDAHSPAAAAGKSPRALRFEDHLINHQLYPWCRIPNSGQSTSPRPSAFPETTASRMFSKLAVTYWTTKSEQELKAAVISALEGNDSSNEGRGIQFENLAPLTSTGGAVLVNARPDVVHGARAEQLNREIREELDGLIVPSTEADDIPIASNFFLLIASAEASSAEVERDACYYSALTARGMYALRLYRQNRPVNEKSGYIVTATYSLGVLELYSTCMADYRTGRIGAWPLHGKLETFLEGVNAYRNARDWAKQQRDEAIRVANARHSLSIGIYR
ncbi:hypothetical protein BJX99DRAFT_258144 [Aspergillus californicus]